jgi:hypothetical protein
MVGSVRAHASPVVAFGFKNIVINCNIVSRVLGKEPIFRPLRLPVLRMLTILTHVRDKPSIMAPAALLLEEFKHHVCTALSTRSTCPLFQPQGVLQRGPIPLNKHVLKDYLK